MRSCPSKSENATEVLTLQILNVGLTSQRKGRTWWKERFHYERSPIYLKQCVVVPTFVARAWVVAPQPAPCLSWQVHKSTVSLHANFGPLHGRHCKTGDAKHGPVPCTQLGQAKVIEKVGRNDETKEEVILPNTFGALSSDYRRRRCQSC